MRGTGASSIVAVLSLVVAAGCRPAREAPLPAMPPAPPNAWAALADYTPEQMALLAPVKHAVAVPAERVLPDLARFGYAGSRKLTSPDEPLKFTRLVASVLRASPRFYSLDTARPSLANPIVQYGPRAGEADGFKVTRRAAEGAGELVSAEVTDDAKAAYDRGEKLSLAGDFAGAADAYRKAIQRSPGAPALRHALGKALMAAGHVDAAMVAYADALGVDPTFAPVHIGLAEIAERRGDVQSARRELTEGLAYEPASVKGLEMAQRLGGRRWGAAPGTAMGAGVGPGAFAIFLDVDALGAIHVATGRSGPAQIYGGCRAIMRFEPELRAKIFEERLGTPYYLHVVEEVVCLEAALGAYMAERIQDEGTADPAIERLLRIARDEGLAGYAMFEILGQHRPERARVAPPEVHRAVAAYVERHVFGAAEGMMNSPFTAMR